MISFLRPAVPVVALLVLAACDPAQTVDSLGRRTAESVVRPVLASVMSDPQAAGVTRCVVQNASADEVRMLVRDVANVAGTSTEATIARIVARPETLSCITTSGVARSDVARSDVAWRGVMRVLFVVMVLPVLAACGPIPVQQAERECFERARLAVQPRGEVGFGVDSTGRSATNLSVTITSDYINGRDPSAVYDACVYQKSGQPPGQPLYTRTDWRG